MNTDSPFQGECGQGESFESCVAGSAGTCGVPEVGTVDWRAGGLCSAGSEHRVWIGKWQESATAVQQQAGFCRRLVR